MDARGPARPVDCAHGRARSSGALHCDSFYLHAAAARAKPEFDSQRVDRKTNPECDSEELAWLGMRQRTSREKNAHYRSRGSNPEKDSTLTRQQLQFRGFVAL